MRRLGTFSYPAADIEFRASTGLAVIGDDIPTGQTLVYFDRPVRIEGVGESDGYTMTYDLQITEAGVAWVEITDAVEKQMLITERRTAGRETLTIHVREITYLPVVREPGGYRLFDQFFANDDLERLPESLSKYPGKEVLVTGTSNITIGDMLTLLPVLQQADYRLLFRDGDGNIHPVDVEKGF